MRSGGRRTAGGESLRARLWAAVGRLGRGLPEAEHEQLVAGLVLLRCLNVRFEGARATLLLSGRAKRPARTQPKAANLLLEDRARYPSDVTWLPPRSRWEVLEACAGDERLGRAVDIAIAGVEQANAELRAVFPQDYARPELARAGLAALIAVLGEFPARPDSADLAELTRVAREFCGATRPASGRTVRHRKLLTRLGALLPATPPEPAAPTPQRSSPPAPRPRSQPRGRQPTEIEAPGAPRSRGGRARTPGKVPAPLVAQPRGRRSRTVPP